MKHVMAVYDLDPFYAARFAEVVNQKEKIPFEVVAFSTLEKLREYGRENRISILLISSAVSREEVEQLRAERVVTLADGETTQADMEYPSIYKYQSSDAIVREVMACYSEKVLPLSEMRMGSRTKILGVFSPVGRCLKTSFAITLGKLLSQEERTLYVNLEGCSGLAALTHTEYRTDLSDLLYFYEGGNYNHLRLNGVVYSMESLDYIPPVKYPEDLEQAGPEAVEGLLGAIAAGGTYETLVVDVGGIGKIAVPVLGLCSVIYMPVKEDSISLAKLEEFERYLEESGNGELLQRIRKLKLPYHSCFGRRENYLEQLLWGELGDYTRQLLKGGWKT